MDTVLVTGVGKRNIGLGIAKRLACEGHGLILVDCLPIEEETIQEIKECGKVSIVCLKADIGCYDSLRGMIEKSFEMSADLKHLVNAAGISHPVSPLEITPQKWNEMMAVNLSGTFFCCQLFIEGLLKKKSSGSIVNIASMAAKSGGVHNGLHYAASKAGIVAFTKGFARYFGSERIRVNAVSPGIVDTALATDFDFFVRQGKSCPLGRLAKVSEVANVVNFLLSEESSYITGESLTVSGGL